MFSEIAVQHIAIIRLTLSKDGKGDWKGWGGGSAASLIATLL